MLIKKPFQIIKILFLLSVFDIQKADGVRKLFNSWLPSSWSSVSEVKKPTNVIPLPLPIIPNKSQEIDPQILHTIIINEDLTIADKLEEIAKYCKKETINALKEYPDTANAEMTPLQLACYLSDDDEYISIVNYLVAQGAMVNTRISNSPLLITLANDNPLIAEKLIDSGAEITTNILYYASGTDVYRDILEKIITADHIKNDVLFNRLIQTAQDQNTKENSTQKITDFLTSYKGQIVLFKIIDQLILLDQAAVKAQKRVHGLSLQEKGPGIKRKIEKAQEGLGATIETIKKCSNEIVTLLQKNPQLLSMHKDGETVYNVLKKPKIITDPGKEAIDLILKKIELSSGQELIDLVKYLDPIEKLNKERDGQKIIQEKQKLLVRIQKLCKRNPAIINNQDGQGNTALHYVSLLTDDQRFHRLLLDSGAVATIKNFAGSTAQDVEKEKAKVKKIEIENRQKALAILELLPVATEKEIAAQIKKLKIKYNQDHPVNRTDEIKEKLEEVLKAESLLRKQDQGQDDRDAEEAKAQEAIKKKEEQERLAHDEKEKEAAEELVKENAEKEIARLAEKTRLKEAADQKEFDERKALEEKEKSAKEETVDSKKNAKKIGMPIPGMGNGFNMQELQAKLREQKPKNGIKPSSSLSFNSDLQKDQKQKEDVIRIEPALLGQSRLATSRRRAESKSVHGSLLLEVKPVVAQDVTQSLNLGRSRLDSTLQKSKAALNEIRKNKACKARQDKAKKKEAPDQEAIEEKEKHVKGVANQADQACLIQEVADQKAIKDKAEKEEEENAARLAEETRLKEAADQKALEEKDEEQRVKDAADQVEKARLAQEELVNKKAEEDRLAQEVIKRKEAEEKAVKEKEAARLAEETRLKEAADQVEKARLAQEELVNKKAEEDRLAKVSCDQYDSSIKKGIWSIVGISALVGITYNVKKCYERYQALKAKELEGSTNLSDKDLMLIAIKELFSFKENKESTVVEQSEQAKQDGLKGL